MNDGATMPELGLIDGRFGRPWTMEERAFVIGQIAGAGYAFYHHGPKADVALRDRWREGHGAAATDDLAALSHLCRTQGLRFGLALTPVGATHPFDAQAQADLARRIGDFDAIGVDDLLILFDDLRGDLPDLAARQADVVDFAAQRTAATRVYTCPTYYSDDPVLDAVFGARPDDYLADLGRCLDPAVRVYWTGEEVCARAIEPSHLARVSGELGRRVTLWDNYPVNDGPRMSRFLHLRAMTGRSADNAAYIDGHAINPALQAHLGCIPALTLPQIYALGANYAHGAAFMAAATALLGPDLAAMVRQDLTALQDVGLERLGARADRLRARYAPVDHPAAQEIVRWLNGDDLMDDSEVQT